MRTSTLICITAMLFSTAVAEHCLASENEWLSYTDLGVHRALDENWGVFSRSQAIVRNHFSTLYFGLVDIGASYRINGQWKVGAAMRKVWYRPGDEWIEGNRPLIELAWSRPLGEVKWLNRSRVEYCTYDKLLHDDVRFRNKTRAELTRGIGLFKPYFEEEFFWTRNSGKVVQNWLTAGVWFTTGDHLKLRLGYRWVAVRKDAHWENRNAIVSDIGIRF